MKMKKTVPGQNNQIWGGRFETAPVAIMQQMNTSIETDKRLWQEDIEGSKAHCAMLVEQGIISQADGQEILDGLTQIAAEIVTGIFRFKTELEDIHMNIESRLQELIGDAAGRFAHGAFQK